MCEPENGHLELSDKGKLEGMECLARHEKLTQFFQMVSGMDQQRAQEDACRVEHYISPEGLKGIENFLQYGDVYDRVYDDMSRVEKKRGAQGSIAESYGVNRSTVNRYFKNCIERGILTESLEFTAAGEEWLERYTKLYENLEKYLEEIGAKPEEIEESLDVMVENIDIHMLELMINAYTEKKSVYKKKENELDQEIQHNLQKCERHPVVFRLYRMNKKAGAGKRLYGDERI